MLEEPEIQPPVHSEEKEEPVEYGAEYFRKNTSSRSSKERHNRFDIKSKRAKRKEKYINENKRFSTHAQKAGKRDDVPSSALDEDILFGNELEEKDEPKKETIFKKKEKVSRPEKKEVPEEVPFVNTIEESSEKEKKQKRNKALRLIYQLGIAAACAYFIFLTYGVIMTDYSYNANGVIEPAIMTVQDIRNKKEYDLIIEQYYNCRSLYERVLVLDYRVSQGIEDPMTIAPEYNALLEDNKNRNDVSDLLANIKGMDIPAKYSSIQNMLQAWVSTDMAEYLQLANDGLSLNDSGILTEALSRRTVIYDDFSIITQNLVSLGESLNGVDLTEMKQWSPEAYVDSYINGD